MFLGRSKDSWFDELDEEDLNFIKRFLLASGSLKDLAAAYDISYPTVRLRLDRLIEKIKVIESEQISSPFERLLRLQFAAGKIDADTLRKVLAAHKQELEVIREEAIASDADGDVDRAARPSGARRRRAGDAG